MQWYKEGKRVPQESAALFLREVKAEDGGNYTCKAENSGGSDEDAIYVTVHSESIPENLLLQLAIYISSFRVIEHPAFPH